MKKILVFGMILTLSLSLCACGGKKEEDNKETPPASSVESSAVTPDTPADTPATPDTPAAPAASADDPVGVLGTAWNLYAEDDKFPVYGGDFSEANNKMGEPSVYSLESPEDVDSYLGLPADSIDKVDSAASLIHMMNANTFTAAAFHVAGEGDVSAVKDALENHISNREWMCGFPDKLVIIRVDNTLISMFGNTELIDTFTDKIKEAYPQAQVMTDKGL